MLVFRTAISTCLHDTRELMFTNIPMSVAPLLPVEAPDGGLYPYAAPSNVTADSAKALLEQFCNILTDVTSYTEDFLVELQNNLLGDLFGNKIAHREPLDPQSKVVTLAQAEELENWFIKNTNWGQKMTEVLSATKKRFSTE